MESAKKKFKKIYSKTPDELWYSIILLFTAPMEGIPLLVRWLPAIGIILCLIALKYKQLTEKFVLCTQIVILVFSFFAGIYTHSLFWRILYLGWFIIENLNVFSIFRKKSK